MSVIEKFKMLLVNWEKVKLVDFNDNNFNIKKMRKILNDVKYRSLQDYRNKELKDIDMSMGRLNNFLTATMGWIHCNPSKIDVKNLSDEAFLLPIKKRDDTKILNTEQGIKTFFNYLISSTENNKIVNIVGRKGEGKTYTQNYFLNHYTDDLSKYNYTWFRVDLTKILRYQRVYSEWMSIEKYLYTQIVYVYFRYSQQMNEVTVDKLLAQINIDELKLESYAKYIKNYEEFRTEDDFNKHFNRIRQKCIDIYKGEDGLNKPFERVNEKMIKVMAQSIINLLKKQGSNYLLFIDGFDNVDYIYDENSDKWIDQIYNKGIDIHISPSKIILTCRRETLSYIENYLARKPYGKCTNDKMEEFSIEALSHKDILNKFLPYILNKELDNFPTIVKKMKESGIDKELLEGTNKELLQDFYDFGLNFDEYVAIAITERHKKEFILESKDILEKIYNGSLRDILYDIKHAYMYIHYYLKGESSRKKTQLQTVIEYLNKNKEKRSFLILAALPRNGNIYFNNLNVFEPPYMLIHSLNLFSVIDLRKHINSESKDALLSVIILKYLDLEGTKFRDEIIKHCLSEGFNYIDIIEKIDLKLLEHGLLEIDLEGAEDENYKKLPRVITERGRYTLTAIKDMNVLHSFSYMMYFPQEFIQKGIVKAHKNDLSDYSSAQVTNVLSILKLLQIYQMKIHNKVFDIFNENIKNQLISFVISMNPREVNDIIEKFQKFLDLYGNLSNNSCEYTEDELYDMYDNKEFGRDELKRRLNQCGYR